MTSQIRHCLNLPVIALLFLPLLLTALFRLLCCGAGFVSFAVVTVVIVVVVIIVSLPLLPLLLLLLLFVRWFVLASRNISLITNAADVAVAVAVSVAVDAAAVVVAVAVAAIACAVVIAANLIAAVLVDGDAMLVGL